MGNPARPKLILDADTANEIDDLFAIVRPDLAKESKVTTPPENVQGGVWMYDRIDVEAMKQDYWQTLSK